MTLHSPPSDDAKRRGYEAGDLRRGALPLAIGLIVLGVLLIQWLTYEIYHRLQRRSRAVDTPSSAVTSADIPAGRTLPPLLPEDVRPLRAQENKVFARLGWQTSGDSAAAKIPDAVIDAVRERK